MDKEIVDCGIHVDIPGCSWLISAFMYSALAIELWLKYIVNILGLALAQYHSCLTGNTSESISKE